MTRLNWGLIGGGEDSQIGYVHRSASIIDRKFEFVAAAMDVDPERSREFAIKLGIKPDRAYGSWQEMLAAERNRGDRLDLVTVATPNHLHYMITRELLRSGINVLCEKPLTMNVDEAKDLVDLACSNQCILAVSYGYSGYPMIRQMRQMINQNKIGKVRVVVTEFAGGFMADANDDDNPRVRWRFDPEQAGVAAVSFDLGSHAMHLACFVTGQSVTAVSSDFAHGVPGRQLEDDGLTAFRMSSGAIGRMWTSGLAIGRTHGLTLQVFGETGGLRWQQEQPNQLRWTPLNGSTCILERGALGLDPLADRASRITVGHPEGLKSAFANIYHDLSDAIHSRRSGNDQVSPMWVYPSGEDGLHSLEIVYAQVESAVNNSRWVEVSKSTSSHEEQGNLR